MMCAERAAAAGDVPIGALLHVDGWMFEGWNEKEARPDPTAHAEMIVLAQAARVLGRWRIGGTLYVTKEPCAMCDRRRAHRTLGVRLLRSQRRGRRRRHRSARFAGAQSPGGRHQRRPRR
jgi:tRNA(adenine34) deaminase